MGFDFVREYVNAPTFRGFKRMHVTAYGDQYGAMENALAFLGDLDVLDFKGATITLSGFEYDGGRGIYVGVNGYHLGTVWKSAGRNDEFFDSLYDGSIAGVFLRLERDSADPERAWVRLFIKPQ